jgi:protein-S-isoprenylcysteine O-methyltransferase Ste14
MSSPTDPRRFPFPPGIPIACLLFGWALGKIWPIPMDWPAWTRWAGWFFFIAPWFFAFWAMATFRRHKTEVNPLGKVTTIVTAGPFRLTRNPMYLSLMVFYCGGIVAFRLSWSAILLPLVFFALHGVIVREERHMQTLFGEQYTDYCSRVRRWL